MSLKGVNIKVFLKCSRNCINLLTAFRKTNAEDEEKEHCRSTSSSICQQMKWVMVIIWLSEKLA